MAMARRHRFLLVFRYIYTLSEDKNLIDITIVPDRPITERMIIIHNINSGLSSPVLISAAIATGSTSPPEFELRLPEPGGLAGSFVTVKLTSKDSRKSLSPLIVTVALYVPVPDPLIGVTLNEPSSPTAISLKTAADNENLVALAPLRSRPNAPVFRLPWFDTTTVKGV